MWKNKRLALWLKIMLAYVTPIFTLVSYYNLKLLDLILKYFFLNAFKTDIDHKHFNHIPRSSL